MSGRPFCCLASDGSDWSLQAIQALATSRRTYLNAVIDYNIAQFQLCRAIGWFEGA